MLFVFWFPTSHNSYGIICTSLPPSLLPTSLLLTTFFLYIRLVRIWNVYVCLDCKIFWYKTWFIGWLLTFVIAGPFDGRRLRSTTFRARAKIFSEMACSDLLFDFRTLDVNVAHPAPKTARTSLQNRHWWGRGGQNHGIISERTKKNLTFWTFI